MMIGPISDHALGAPAVSSITHGAAPGRLAAGAGAHADFAGLLGEAISDVAHKLRAAEAVSIAGIKGTATTQEVVEKVMAAEQSLQAAITIRDKVVSAYMEINRMAI